MKKTTKKIDEDKIENNKPKFEIIEKFEPPFEGLISAMNLPVEKLPLNINSVKTDHSQGYSFNLINGSLRYVLYDKSGNKNIFCDAGSVMAPFIHDEIESNAQRIFITEGETDMMSLMAYTNNVIAIPGANNTNCFEDNIDKIKEIIEVPREIVVCFDSDEPGRNGSNSMLKILANSFPDTKLKNFNPSTLGNFKDIRELLSECSFDQLKAKISKIDDYSYLLNRIYAASQIESDAIDIPISFKDKCIYFYLGKKSNRFLLFSDGTDKIKISDTNNFEEVIGDKERSNSDVDLKILYKVLKKIKNNPKNWDDFGLFNKIENLLKSAVYFSNEYTYKTLSSYIILTYIFPCFKNVPFLHIWGQAATGKSELCKILFKTVYNGIFEGSGSTVASIRRTLHEKRGTLILDDCEILSNNSDETQQFRSQLNSSYSTTYSESICYGKDNKPKDFRIGGPKILNSINQLEGVLQSRTIIIETEKASPEFKQLDEKKIDEMTKSLKPQLLAFALCCHNKIRSIFENTSMECNRSSDLLKPLTSIALFFNTHPDYPNLDSFIQSQFDYSENIKKNNRKTFDDVICEAIFEAWMDAKMPDQFYIDSNTLADIVISMDDPVVPASNHAVKSMLTTALNRTGLLISKSRKNVAGIKQAQDKTLYIKVNRYEVNIQRLNYLISR